MVLVDNLCGYIFSFLQSHAKGGSTKSNYYLANNCDADILILGSSRAQFHYIPQILDSLGGFAYNAGESGMGIICALGRYQLCAEKHTPKIVIYEITPIFDFEIGDNLKYLKYLRPYGDRTFIRNIFHQLGDPLIDLKMMSKMYRNTSRIIRNIRDFFVNEKIDNRGYIPRLETCNNCDNSFLKEFPSSFELDSIKLKIFDQFVKETANRGSKLYFAISPRFTGLDSTDSAVEHKLPVNHAYAEILAGKYNIPLLNNLFITGISNNPNLFADQVHLNKDGAKSYTRRIVQELQAFGGTD